MVFLQKRRRKVHKKTGALRLVLFVPFWIVLAVSFGGVILTQAEKRGRRVSEITSAGRELDRLRQLSRDLEHEIRFNTEDKAVEKAARDQLGLVYPDEIIFVTE